MKIKNLLALLCMCLASLSLAQVNIKYGLFTYQNTRPYQEDRFAHAKIDKGEFFGVYDGHGGDKVSSFLKDKLHVFFGKARGSLQKKFERAFEQADYISQNSFKDGSTAVVVYIDKNNRVHLAWVGDSRAVLESNGSVALATQDHKPDRSDEKQRIEKAGGEVLKHGVWRVNGLAVSRSIGDVSLKKMGVGQIIATPEYAQMQLTADNHFLILASDGLWDVMSNEDCVKMVRAALSKNKSLDVIAEGLAREAIKQASGDNITVSVIQFDWSSGSRAKSWWSWLWGK